MEQHKILCSIPVAVLVVIAALDAADKALLAASFPMLEKTLHLHGLYFSLMLQLFQLQNLILALLNFCS
jgi:hypothetical protein